MRIRYIKNDGSGRVDDLPDEAARRLIDSGAAEEVDADEPVTTDEPRPATPRKSAAKKTTRRSK
jgi:hypothetical protein